MPSQLLIFDLDGTLVDTSTQVNEITAALLKNVGVTIQAADIAALLPLNSLGAAPKIKGIAELFKVDIPPLQLDQMAAQHEKRKQELYEQGNFHLFEGLGECLAQLQKNFVLAIGSNSPSTASEQALKTAGLLSFFAGRIYGPDNTGGVSKPAPDVFIQAASKCGFDALHATVIGDSLTDLEAAVKAGMPCYIIMKADEDSAIRADYTAKGCAGFFASYDEFPDLGNQ